MQKKTPMLLRTLVLIYLSIASLFLPAIAGATLIISSGLVGGSGDVENVLFHGTGTVDGPALTVTGITNSTSYFVNFTGTENLLTFGGGQARIEAADGFFDYLKIELKEPTLGFAKIQFNIDSEFDGNVNLAFTDQYGTVFQGNFLLDDNGQNFFTAYSLDNQVIVKAVISSTTPLQAITDLAQVRLSPTSLTQSVPEPATMLLLGTGLIGLAGLARKKFRT